MISEVMDFHSLPRKELQSLCKKNKIPANMTNLSMADALKALIHVEGLEDILNQTEFNPLQSPENPRTARRKPSNAESGCSKSLTSARRASRRKDAEEVKEENKNANVPETPAALTTRRAIVHSARQKVEIHLEEAKEGQEKRDVPETLAVPTSRRRAPATSTHRKVDGQEDEGSVQRVYSTRRSVRLLEKSMSGLSLKEKRTEPIKMIEYVENEGKKETSESAQATDGLESSGQISDGLLEEDLNDSHDFSVVEGCALPEKVSAEIMDHATDSQFSPQHEKNDSKNGEFLFSSGGDESKMVELASTNPDLEPKYAIDEDSKADESQEKPFDFHQENGNGEVSKDIASQEKPNDFHQENGNGEVSKDIASLHPEVKYESAKGSETLPEVSQCCDVNDFPDDSTAEDNSGSGSSFEHIADEIDEEESINADNVETLSCLMENNNTDGRDADVRREESINADNVVTLSCLTENKTDGPDADVREEFNFTSTLSDKVSEFVKQISPTYPQVSEGKAEDPIALPKMGEYDSRALIVDINVAKSEEFGTQENFPSLDKKPSRGKGIGHAHFAPDSFPGQFPRPNLPSTEKQTTFPMMIQDLGINRKNYEMISCDLEIRKDEMRKEKNVIDKGHKIALEGESIRSLKKMLKRNLTINESTKDKDSNFTKEEGKTRPALQKLPENCMPVEM